MGGGVGKKLSDLNHFHPPPIVRSISDYHTLAISLEA